MYIHVHIHVTDLIIHDIVHTGLPLSRRVHLPRLHATPTSIATLSGNSSIAASRSHSAGIVRAHTATTDAHISRIWSSSAYGCSGVVVTGGVGWSSHRGANTASAEGTLGAAWGGRGRAGDGHCPRTASHAT